MPLRTSISDFDDAIVRLEAGRKILDECIRPLLKESSTYYKISSFFSPSVVKGIIFELAECIRRKGSVKLIIGVHDSGKLIPVLDQIERTSKYDKFKLAVQKIVSDNIQDCIKLLDEPRNFLPVFAELINQNLIQIKIASVKKDFLAYEETGKWPENDSIFHPKVSIFKDDTDAVVMNGSINSTNKGFGGNTEQATFTGSWFSPKPVNAFLEIFDEIWNGTHGDSYTMEFNDEIRDVVKEIIQNSTAFKTDAKDFFSSLHLGQLINSSPFFFHHSFNKVRLLPHQHAVYRLMLSRWPIAGLVADEVGLGKTIEAGAIVKYSKHFFSLKRIALLVPSALRSQWQREMYNLFGLEFYIYDSNSKSLTFSPNNDTIDIIRDVTAGNYFSHGVENIIFSWHYLRSNNGNQFKLSAEDNIDMVVVDEAHGARLTENLSGDIDSTLLFQFLQNLLAFIPHKVLLTATPFQTSSLDYVALLRLLMGNDNMDESSLERIAFINSGRELVNQQKIDGMLELLTGLSYNTKDIPAGIDLSDYATLFDLYNDSLYVENHPTTIYTLRNTRDKLKEIGYQFPIVNLHSKPIELSKKQLRIFQLATDYIENHLFSFEAALGIRGIGLVKSIYHQRIVSSTKACYDTLRGRSSKLEECIRNGIVGSDFADLDGDDEPSVAEFNLQRTLTPAEISVAEGELDFVKELIRKIEIKLFENGTITDAKIDELFSLISLHLSQGDKVIIFSRFTSTTDFIIQKFIHQNAYSVGRYQGNLKQIIKDKSCVNVERQTISDRFNSNEFPVIVCSDAASEGLNLQTANVIINVDVPWNPARMLQRFGRIDRFGQRKSHIYFYNLFYPGSLEDRMYSRLHQRNIEFREVLGATPEITSQLHVRDLQSRELIERDHLQNFSYRNSLISLSASDNVRIHEVILSRLDAVMDFKRDSDTLSYLGKSFAYSINELDADYLDLNHKILNEFDENYSGEFVSLHELKNKAGVLFFYCILRHGKIYPILDIENILDYIILKKPIEINGSSVCISSQSIQEDFFQLLGNTAFKLINHSSIEIDGLSTDFYQGISLVPTGSTIACKFV